MPYEIRTIREFLGQLMSTELLVKEATQNLNYKLRLKATQVQFVNRLTNATDFLQALEDAPDALLFLTGAQGAAVCEGDRIALIGNTPGREEVLDLLKWCPIALRTTSLSPTFCLASIRPLQPIKSRKWSTGDGHLKNPTSLCAVVSSRIFANGHLG